MNDKIPGIGVGRATKHTTPFTSESPPPFMTPFYIFSRSASVMPLKRFCKDKPEVLRDIFLSNVITTAVNAVGAPWV